MNDVQKYAIQMWVTRNLREDSAVDVDTMLARNLHDRAADDGWDLQPDSVHVDWRSRDTDPMAFMFDLPEADSPMRGMWDRGDLFYALVTGRVTRR